MNKKQINPNSIPSVNEIVTGMNTISPRSKKNNRGTSYESIATEYLLRTINELCKAEIDDNNNKLIYVTNIRENFNYQYNGGKRWLDWLNKNHALFIMIQQGNILSKSPKPSVVKSMISDSQLLEYRLNHDFSSLYEVISHADWITPINTKSLRNFIISSNLELTTATNKKHKDKIKRNIANACELMDIARLNNNTIPQTMTEKTTGRYYASGVNLQNGVSSTVREAALGECYKYDIHSASYAFRLSYIKQQQPEAKTPAMIELVEQKKLVRTRLAKECLTHTRGSLEHKIKLVKSALTSMGFGAKTHGPFASLQDIIWNVKDRNQFLSHWYIVELQAELKLFTELLLADIGKADLKKMLKLQPGESYSQNKAEAHLYQRAESIAMQRVFDNIRGECLLWVHDCAYVTKSQDITELNYKLQEDPFWQYASFESEQIKPWINPIKTDNYVISPTEEEHSAQLYNSKFVDTPQLTQWDIEAQSAAVLKAYYEFAN